MHIYVFDTDYQKQYSQVHNIVKSIYLLNLSSHWGNKI